MNVSILRRPAWVWYLGIGSLVTAMYMFVPPPGFTPFPGFVPPPPRPGDARALARLELVDLQGVLRTALARPTDRATRAHFLDMQARIDRILNPR